MNTHSSFPRTKYRKKTGKRQRYNKSSFPIFKILFSVDRGEKRMNEHSEERKGMGKKENKEGREGNKRGRVEGRNRTPDLRPTGIFLTGKQ